MRMFLGIMGMWDSALRGRPILNVGGTVQQAVGLDGRSGWKSKEACAEASAGAWIPPVGPEDAAALLLHCAKADSGP